MVHVRKKKEKAKEKTKMTTDVDNIFFFFLSFSFILRKSLADEMIICLLSCVVTTSLLMIDGKIE